MLSHGKLRNSDSSLFQKSLKEVLQKLKQLSLKKSQETKIKISEHISIDMPGKMLHFSLLSWDIVIPLYQL